MSSLALQDYFLRNYSLNCPPTTYLRSHEFFATSVHILSPFSVLLGIYGIVVIVVATPKSMESAKWFILKLHISTFYIELVVNILLMPFMFLPSGAIYSTGILMQIGFPFKLGHIIGQEAFPVYAISIVMLYENRHSVITTIPYRMTKKRTKRIFYTIHYVIAMFIITIPYFETFDTDTEKLNILKRMPCPDKTFFNEKSQVLSTNLSLVYKCGGFEWLYFGGMIAFFSFQSSFYLLRKPSSTVSERTRNLQKRFFITLTVQLAIPVVVLAIPVLIFYYSIANGIIEQFLSSLVVIICSFHGIVSSISLVLLHKPYRGFTWNLTFGRFSNFFKTAKDQSVRPSVVAVL